MSILQVHGVIWAEPSLYADQPHDNPDVQDGTATRTKRASCRELVVDFDSDENFRTMLRVARDCVIKDNRPLIFGGAFACRPP
jgi:hypothetical protein